MAIWVKIIVSQSDRFETFMLNLRVKFINLLNNYEKFSFKREVYLSISLPNLSFVVNIHAVQTRRVSIHTNR